MSGSAHYNFVENIAGVLFSLFVTGLSFPRLASTIHLAKGRFAMTVSVAAVCGLLYVIARALYAWGYNSGLCSQKTLAISSRSFQVVPRHGGLDCSKWRVAESVSCLLQSPGLGARFHRLRRSRRRGPVQRVLAGWRRRWIEGGPARVDALPTPAVQLLSLAKLRGLRSSSASLSVIVCKPLWLHS